MDEMTNIAETLAKEMARPVELGSEPHGNIKRLALPPGWSLKEMDDDERLLVRPRRKLAAVELFDAPSFIAYVKRHGSLAISTIWCVVNYPKGQVSFKAILNDHGETPQEPDWRDHLAIFNPQFSEEWNRWFCRKSQPFSQADFAAFIEDNRQDIAAVEEFPTGAQMLEMALTFEAVQDSRFKSAIRLQSGGQELAFVQTDDAATVQKMCLFDRFAIGIPVFWGGEAYRIDARLRYRVKEGKLVFWFELVRPDKVLEAATKTLIEQIGSGTGNPFFFGDPFSN